MKIRLPQLAAIVLGLSLSITTQAGAQGVPSSDTRRLTQLYEALLLKGEDPVIGQRITEERARLRTLIDDELNSAVNRSLRGSGELLDLRSAYDKQHLVVSSLEEKKRETKVDLALLIDEEKLFDESGSGALVTTDVGVRRTRAQQMARHALLDERIQSVDFFLTAQNARLRELEFQQRWEQFSVFINLARYILIIIGVLVFAGIVRNRFLQRITSPTRRYAVMKMFSGAIYVLLALWLINDLFAEHPNILTSFAILGAGITFAMQDIVKNLLGWLIIIRGRSFSLGQRIAIGPHLGDVVDIGLLHTTLLEVNHTEPGRSGKALVLPNAKVLTEAVLNQNATSDFVIAEIDILVKHGTDWKAAERILQEILHEETNAFAEMAKEQAIVRMQKFFFSREPLGATVFIDITEKGISFTLHFLVPIGQRGFITSAINRKILDRFAANEPPIVFVTA